MAEWDYMAGRINGDGYVDIIETELPLSVDSISRKLSAPSTMTGSIENEIKSLKNNGQPVFQSWNTVILAVASDQIRAMGIYQKPSFKGKSWTLNTISFGGYPYGMPYVNSKYFIDADPLDIFRHAWNHLQSQPGGNLGVTIDPLTSPVRVGEQVRDVNFVTGAGEQVAFEAGPRKLAWYLTDDIGKELDGYAKETPFDWREDLSWKSDSQPHCHLSLGYPSIGSRKDTRLVLGENLATEPGVVDGDYVSQVLVRGAGEGRDAVRGYAAVVDGRLRRIRTVEDRSKRSIKAANALAAKTLASTRGQWSVDTLEVYDHPNAPLEAIELGDELELFAETDHFLVDGWVRVVGKEERPDKVDVATLTVTRMETA